MPDILGNWDRRADEDDYNPMTGRVEPGHAEAQRKRWEKEKTEKRQQDRIWELFHKLWGRDKEHSDYDKSEWVELQLLMEKYIK